jgi:hypothetical protein
MKVRTVMRNVRYNCRRPRYGLSGGGCLYINKSIPCDRGGHLLWMRVNPAGVYIGGRRLATSGLKSSVPIGYNYPL